jgi:hypothetical protein
MARALRPESRIDRGLRLVQSHGSRRGIRGGSRGWFWVFVVVWVSRRVRHAIGSEPAVVYRGELQPGDTIEISHQTETYGGNSVRRR